MNDLITILENKGILVYLCQIDSSKFSGMNGFVNDRPYIMINSSMSPERIRSTIAHELAHLVFDWPEEYGGEGSGGRRPPQSQGRSFFPKRMLCVSLGYAESESPMI